jgi:RND superfamily putative drug exporter
MSEHRGGVDTAVEGSLPARLIRKLSLPILLIWIAIAAVSNTVSPQLEVVGWERSVGQNAADAPGILAMRHIGEVFHEFDSDSAAMLVIEGDQPLGPEAHKYYDGLVKRLQADKEHVEHVQDFWGDPLTAGGSQSKDGKAALTQLYLRGNQGEAMSNISVDAVRKIVAADPPPPGIRAYITGASPLVTDNFEVGSAGTNEVTGVTFLVIGIMLLFVYRSLVTMLIVLLTVAVELAAARGVVAVLAHAGVIGLSTYATNLLTLLAIAAGTDYAIFVVGRYQEARGKGMDRISAYHDMWHGTVHVMVGSGLTIAGAVACMSFARLPYFQTLGIPAAIGVLVTLAAALTLGPAVLLIATRFGLMEPKVAQRARGWRKIGTAIVRWPGPILVVTTAIALIGIFALPGFEVSYDNRPYIPASAPGVVGMEAAERHFTEARINPELLMIEADHDMRNPADMLILERAAKAVLHTPGIALVQSITRPLGTPITHSSIPFQISASSASQIMNLGYQKDRANDLLKQAGEIDNTIGVLKQQLSLQKQSAAATHEQVEAFHDTVVTVNDLRNKLADFDDQFRPLRNYFYWEPHCFDIPMCSALRSVFDSLDGISDLSDKFGNITASLDKLDALQPQLVALIPPQIAIQERNRELTLSNYATTGGTNSQSDEALKNATAMGKAFDDAKNDDTFYLPPEAFDNADFKRGLKLFLSPDGKAARMIVTHQGNPANPEAIPHINAIKDAVFDALKATPMSDAKIYVAGIGSTNKDIQEGTKYDLLISALAAVALILLIMVIVTRSIVAAAVIVGTVVLSLGASIGLSVLVWQYIFGIHLYWVVVPLAIILLLAVGADYNLLLVSRFKEEMHAGLNTGIIRSMGGTGSVVTAAGLVFSATMAAFIFSPLVILGQIGTTIGLGLLFDTLVVRSFMTPSIAALLGKWFWWPQIVRQRPVPAEWPAPVGKTSDDDLVGSSEH